MGLSFFPALFDRPAKIKFAYQERNEYIELLLRQHWITNLPWIILSLLGFVAPLAFPYLIAFFESSIGFPIPFELKVAILLLWYMLVFAYVIESFLGWYFNIYIITNLHVIDVDFHNLLNRHITKVRFLDIQSPRARVRGVLASLFHYGDVHIETAAKTQIIDFLAVPKPDFVVDRIQDLQAGR